jgi:hypothetical protein
MCQLQVLEPSASTTGFDAFQVAPPHLTETLLLDDALEALLGDLHHVSRAAGQGLEEHGDDALPQLHQLLLPRRGLPKLRARHSVLSAWRNPPRHCMSRMPRHRTSVTISPMSY